MNKVIASCLFIFVLGVCVYFFISSQPQSLDQVVKQDFSNPVPNSDVVDKTATFEIYTNGTKRIFTSPKYHNLSTSVFIQSESPNTVYVKESGITWGDFFETLPMQLTKECLITGTQQTFCTGEKGYLKFYINDQEDGYALDKVIKEGDSLVVKYEE